MATWKRLANDFLIIFVCYQTVLPLVCGHKAAVRRLSARALACFSRETGITVRPKSLSGLWALECRLKVCSEGIELIFEADENNERNCCILQIESYSTRVCLEEHCLCLSWPLIMRVSYVRSSFDYRVCVQQQRMVRRRFWPQEASQE